MKQRFLSALLVLCMIFMLVPGAAAANMEPTSGSCGENVNWSYDEATKTLTISGTGDMDTDFHWPWIYNQSVEHVIIADGVKSISNSAFNNCPDLREVNIAGSVETILYNAFSNCPNLTDVVIPEGVKRIGIRAFENCSKLTHIVIPSTLTEFKEHSLYGVFQGCPITSAGPIGSGCNIEFGWTDSIPENAFYMAPIQDIILPMGIKSIGASAFDNTDLSEILIPASVIRINGNAFIGCDRLSNIIVDENNVVYSSYDGMLLNKEKTELICCPGGKTSCDIPSSVRTIGRSAFEECKKIENIILPEKLEAIGRNAFAVCDGLTTIKIPDNVENLDSLIFTGCKSLKDVILPGGVRRYIGGLFGQNSGVRSVKIGEGTREIDGMFSDLEHLTTAYLPASLSYIGADTFANCNNLSTVYFAGTQAQFDGLEIDQGNQELRQAEIICLEGGEPEIPDTPDTPEPEAPEPGELPLRVSDGGMGRRVTVTVEGGHWLTIQIRRAGSLAITSVQAPGSGLVAVSFSAPAGSMLQLWETEEEMSFQGGVPGNVVLSAAAEQL